MNTQNITSPTPHRAVPRLSFICGELYIRLRFMFKSRRYQGGDLEMRHSLARSIIRLLVVLAFASVAMAQGGKPPGKDSLYNGNRLKPDPTPGGPAPVHDVSGSWAGNLTPDRGEIPPLTPLGQKLFSLNKPEPEVGTGFSNDPMNTCDPLGVPRNTVFETRGLAFATMSDRIAVLHQYQRIWRYAWMDGRELPKKFDT